jgi:hypothetical protein
VLGKRKAAAEQKQEVVDAARARYLERKAQSGKK